MRMLLLAVFFSGLSARSISAGTNSNVVARNNTTDNVHEFSVHDFPPKSLRIRARSIPVAPTQEDLITYWGISYAVNVSIGGQPLKLVIDTGSVDTWVATADFTCLNRFAEVVPWATCQFGLPYNPAASTTLRLGQLRPFYIPYGADEFVVTDVAEEEISIGGLSSRQTPYFHIEHQIAIAKRGHWRGDGMSSGILGLGLPSTLDTKSFLLKLFREKSTAPILSLALKREPVGALKPSPGGVIAFGGIPNNVNSDGRWVQTLLRHSEIGLDTITIDGFDITPPHGSSAPNANPFIDTPLDMVVDSGSSQLVVPAAIEAYTAGLFDPPGQYHDGKKQYIVACDAQAPRVGIKIAGTSFYISGVDLLMRAPGLGTNDCRLEMTSAAAEDVDLGPFILGSPWLRNVVVAFWLSSNSGSNGQSKGMLLVDGRENY